MDQVSDFVYVHFMQDFTLEETLLTKAAWEEVLLQAGRSANTTMPTMADFPTMDF